jgi:predicted dehydrogenase
MEDTYGHTPIRKAFDLMDVYGVEYDESRAARRKVRLGIIGAGGVAQSKYLPAVARLRMLWEPVEVVAFAEPRESHAHKVQSIYGGRWYRNYRTMLSEEDIDAVLVLSPDHLHAEHTLACLETGRHVLVEMPVARSLLEAEGMCLSAGELDLTLMAAAMPRYSPPYFRARQCIQMGLLAEPALFAGKLNFGYDHIDLFESGTIYLLDLARYFMGDVTTANAVGVNRYRRAKYPLDNAAALFEFASGAIGTISTSSSALSLKPWTRLEVYGDKVWFSVEDGAELLLYDAEEGPVQLWKPVMPHTLLFDEEFGGFMGLIEDFLQVIRGQAKPRVTGWDGYRAYELKSAVQLSLIHQGCIPLPLDPKSADDDILVWLKRSGWPGA